MSNVRVVPAGAEKMEAGELHFRQNLKQAIDRVPVDMRHLVDTVHQNVDFLVHLAPLRGTCGVDARTRATPSAKPEKGLPENLRQPRG
jgi:hypothetical protein